MALEEQFSTMRLPKELRKQIKMMAASRDIPMYQLLEEWARAHTQSFAMDSAVISTQSEAAQNDGTE